MKDDANQKRDKICSKLFLDKSGDSPSAYGHACYDAGFDARNDEVSALNDSNDRWRLMHSDAQEEVTHLKREVERFHKIIAKELSENDELGCEFVYVNVLKAEMEQWKTEAYVLRKGLEETQQASFKHSDLADSLAAALDKIASFSITVDSGRFGAFIGAGAVDIAKEALENYRNSREGK